MHMPGLTAASSLYRSSAFYRSARASGGLPGKREILPQLPIGFCMANCDRIEDDFLRSVCELQCFEQDDTGGRRRQRWRTSTLYSWVRAVCARLGVTAGRI